MPEQLMAFPPVYQTASCSEELQSTHLGNKRKDTFEDHLSKSIGEVQQGANQSLFLPGNLKAYANFGPIS